MTLRLALTSVFRSPGFAAIVVVTLAIGIGATTAMFSIVDAVLLRPLQFPGAERASELGWRPADGAATQPGIPASVFASIREGLADVASVAAYRFGVATVTGGTEPVIVSTPDVTPEVLHTVGAFPLIGRMLGAEDATAGSSAVLIGERFWIAQFGGDPAVVGRRIDIDGESHTIAGVLPAEVRYPEANVAVWRPLAVSADGDPRRRLQVLVVRRPDITLEQLHARLSAMNLSLRSRGVLSGTQAMVADEVVQARFSRDQGQPLWSMLCAVGLVLLVACVNVANLLLVRESNRRGQLAVLSAIGASRSDLLRQVGCEVAIVIAAGAAAGIGLAALLIRVVPLIVPEQLSFLASTTADLSWRVIGFASGLTFIAALVAGLGPTWRASRANALDAIKAHSRSTVGRSDDRWQSALLALQIGSVVVLLVGTGLLLRSFVRLMNVDPGYDPSSLVQLSIQLTTPRYQRAGEALAMMEDLAQRIEDAAVGSSSFVGSGARIHFEMYPDGGRPLDAAGVMLVSRLVSPAYFDVMGIPLLQGRGFTADDHPDVAIMSDSLARRFWGERSVIGQRFRLGVDAPWRTIVGVVSDVRLMGLDDTEGAGTVFYEPHSRSGTANGFDLIVRSSLPGSTVVIPRIKALLWEIDPHAPVIEAGAMRDLLVDRLHRQRLVLRLSVAFAIVALLLAGVGIYGVTASWIARRRRDLAVRVAVGATRGHIAQLVFTRTALVVAAGSALGVVGSLASVRVLRTLLDDADAADPLVLVATTLLMTLLVAAAVAAPTRTALSVDPATVLRDE